MACDLGGGEGVGNPLEDLTARPGVRLGVRLALRSVGLSLGEGLSTVMTCAAGTGR